MSSRVAARVFAIHSMGMAELKEYWVALFGRPSPPYRRAYLVKRLACKVQEQELGGLSARDKARLEMLLDQEGFDALAAKPREKSTRRRSIKIEAGTLLAKEFEGERYEALALEDGSFEFRGLRYKSLTAVVKQITPTPWNPRTFFGLPPLKHSR